MDTTKSPQIVLRAIDAWWLFFLLLSVNCSSALGQESKTSRDLRSEKSLALLGRLPTLTIHSSHGADESIGAGEVGVEALRYISGDLSAAFIAQYGVAGNLGTWAGLGSSGRVLGGLKYFLSNPIFIGATFGLRYVNVGLIEEERNGEATSYDEEYYNSVYGQVTSIDFGTGLTFGWLWQHETMTLGFEAMHIFAPIANASSQSKANHNHSEAEARRRAKRIAGNADFTGPRFLLGFGF